MCGGSRRIVEELVIETDEEAEMVTDITEHSGWELSHEGREYDSSKRRVPEREEEAKSREESLAER
jgi:hypothetical protein